VTVIPRSILGGALLFTSCFIVFNGIQIIADRVLDNRKIIALGLGLFFGIARMLHPELFAKIHPAFASLVQSELTLATLIVLGLSLAFRVGVNRNCAISILMDENRFEAVSHFLQASGAALGARHQPLSRAIAASLEFLELAPGLVAPGTPISMAFLVDDTELTVRISYRGKGLRPGEESRLEPADLEGDANQQAQFSQALLTRLCGEIKASEDRGICELQFLFEQ
jgi:NCS2 family nucleobase:cation symporter-2